MKELKNQYPRIKKAWVSVPTLNTHDTHEIPTKNINVGTLKVNTVKEYNQKYPRYPRNMKYFIKHNIERTNTKAPA